MSQLQDKIDQMKARLDTAGLIQLLDSPQKEVQPVAAQALVDLGSAAVIPLLSLLYDPRPLMQSLAIILLGQIGDTRATEPLVEIWRTKPSRECARALGRIKGPGAYEALVEKLDLSDETLTAWMVSGLELLEEPRSIEPLVRVLQSEMEVTSEKAAGLLIKLGWTPDPKKQNLFMVLNLETNNITFTIRFHNVTEGQESELVRTAQLIPTYGTIHRITQTYVHENVFPWQCPGCKRLAKAFIKRHSTSPLNRTT